MKGLFLAVLMGLLACQPVMPVGSNNSGELLELAPEHTQAFGEDFPTATHYSKAGIPEHLSNDHDRSFGNDELMLLYDKWVSVVGYVRVVFSDVNCVAEACQAIRFGLIFDADFEPVSVFHKIGQGHDLKKYVEDEYLTFSARDLQFINELLLDPPAILVETTDVDEMVEGIESTAPTRPQYQDVVVHGAAFTCYLIVLYSVQTMDILQSMFGQGHGGDL